jgi:hypothetical protein
MKNLIDIVFKDTGNNDGRKNTFFVIVVIFLRFISSSCNKEIGGNANYFLRPYFENIWAFIHDLVSFTI